MKLKRQLVVFKIILDCENDDPVKMSYHEMLKYKAEKNRANNVHGLGGKYNLPLNDENVGTPNICHVEKTVHDRVKHVAFFSLTEMCSANKNTCLLSYDKLTKTPYLTNLELEIARTVFRAKVGVYYIKENFKKKYDGELSYPFCTVDNSLSSLSIYSSATQGFLVRSPREGQRYI